MSKVIAKTSCNNCGHKAVCRYKSNCEEALNRAQTLQLDIGILFELGFRCTCFEPESRQFKSSGDC